MKLAENRSVGDDAANQIRAAHGDQRRHNASDALAEEISLLDPEMLQESYDIGGLPLVAEGTIDIGGASSPL
jgi:hypothetical protein